MSNEIKRSTKHLLCFLVDQASPDAFYGLIDEGVAPYVSKYILGEKTPNNTYSKASISRHIITGFPSTSANTHVSILTGSYAGKNNMLYTNYWNLTGKKPVFEDTEDVKITALTKLNQQFINPAIKTLFEYIPNSASFHAINRGARIKLFTPKSLVTKFLPLLIQVQKKNEPHSINPIAQPELWKTYFLKEIANFLKNIKKTGNLPEASFIVFLLTDENAHKYGFDSIKYKEAVQVLDFFVQSIVEGIKEKKGQHIEGLRELGYLDSIVWCINTDHAGRKIYRDKMIAINDILEIETKLRLVEHQELLDKNVKKEIKILSNINGFSLVCGEFWQAWFGGPQGTKLNDFRRFHGENYFRAIEQKNLPNNLRKQKPTVDLIEYLIQHNYTQFVIIPEDCDTEGTPLEKTNDSHRIHQKIPRDFRIKLFSKIGTSQVIRQQQDNTIYYSYQILQGNDPLKYDNLEMEYNQMYSHEEWLSITLNHDQPDVFHRLFGYFDSIYAGNIVVTSALEYHNFSTFYVAKKKKKSFLNTQTHDGLYSIESVVPLTLAGPGIKKGFEIQKGRNIDILPTILKVMNVSFDERDMDGQIIADIFDD